MKSNALNIGRDWLPFVADAVKLSNNFFISVKRLILEKIYIFLETISYVVVIMMLNWNTKRQEARTIKRHRKEEEDISAEILRKILLLFNHCF